MKQEKTTKEQIRETLSTCYVTADTRDEFFVLLRLNGIETYQQNEQVEGVVIDGKNISLTSLGYSPEAIQSLDPIPLTDEDLALIESYRNQMESEERQLRASDIVPDRKQLEEELGTERSCEREDELEELRGKGGEEKELGHWPER